MERLARRPLVCDLTTKKIKDDVDRLGGRVSNRLSYNAPFGSLELNSILIIVI
jgi:hypothetical protein